MVKTSKLLKDTQEKKEIVKKTENNSRLSSAEFRKIEDELIMVINKLSKVGLQEYATYLSHPLRIFWTNLLAGTARGLGFLLGATIIIAAVSYIVTLLIDIPIIGEFFKNLNDFLETSKNAYSNGID